MPPYGGPSLSFGLAPAALALLQATFLPGFLCVACVRQRRALEGNTFVLAFASSLVVDFFIVYGASLLRLPLRPVFFGVLALEAVALVALVARGWSPSVPSPSAIRRWIASLSAFDRLLLVLGAVSLGLIAAEGLRSLGSVFSAWDPIFSWNRWALSWYAGRIPGTAGAPSANGYPQVIPAVWGMLYAIAGSSELQFLPKAIMPLFPFLTALMLMHLGVVRRSRVFLLGVSVFAVAAFGGFRSGMTDGYVDYAVGFFAMLPLYLILLAEPARLTGPSGVLPPLLFASAGVIVKQPAAYALAATLLTLASVLWRARCAVPRRQLLLIVAIMVAVPLVVIGSWYGTGLGAQLASNYAVTQADQSNTSHLSRLPQAVSLLPGGKYALVALAITFVAAVESEALALVVAAAVILYAMLWALFFSYDTRNLTLLLPWAAFLVSAGLLRLWGRAAAIADSGSLRRARLGSAPLAALAVVMIGSLGVLAAVPTRGVIASQIDGQRAVGLPVLNTQLYRCDLARLPKRSLVTDYVYLRVLPEFRPDVDRLMHNGGYTVTAGYQYWLTVQDVSDAEFLLLSDSVNDAVKRHVRAQLAEGKLHIERTFSTDEVTPWSAVDKDGRRAKVTVFTLYRRNAPSGT